MLLVQGCEFPTVAGVVDSCVTSQKFGIARCGKRVLDYTMPREKVFEWDNDKELKDSPIGDMPDMVCVSLPDWLTRIKPIGKEGHDAWSNQQ